MNNIYGIDLKTINEEIKGIIVKYIRDGKIYHRTLDINNEIVENLLDERSMVVNKKLANVLKQNKSYHFLEFIRNVIAGFFGVYILVFSMINIFAINKPPLIFHFIPFIVLGGISLATDHYKNKNSLNLEYRYTDELEKIKKAKNTIKKNKQLNYMHQNEKQLSEEESIKLELDKRYGDSKVSLNDMVFDILEQGVNFFKYSAITNYILKIDNQIRKLFNLDKNEKYQNYLIERKRREQRKFTVNKEKGKDEESSYNYRKVISEEYNKKRKEEIEISRQKGVEEAVRDFELEKQELMRKKRYYENYRDSLHDKGRGR